MKITSFDKDVKNISKLSDRPNIEDGYTSDGLKEIFDRAGVDIKDYINNVLIAELSSVAKGMSGADRIGSAYIDTVEGDSVQDKLKALSVQINGLANGTLPDGSVTPDKFSPEISAFLTSASLRARLFKGAGEYTFAPSRDGTYKFTIVGGGSGGGVEPENTHRKLGGGGGACAVLWLELKKGDSCQITVGGGGEGLTVSGTALKTNACRGGDTTLTLNGTLVATAEGGAFGKNVRALALSEGINYGGGHALANDYYGTTGGDIEFGFGGSSVLGNGSVGEDDVPGIGGGGFSARYSGNNIFHKGYKGGDGAVLIEYME